MHSEGRIRALGFGVILNKINKNKIKKVFGRFTLIV
jgi:hypothetical protein